MSVDPDPASESEHPGPMESLTIDDLIGLMSVYKGYCDGRTHWHTHVPYDVREWAQEASQSEVDDRDCRDDETSESHSEQGKVAEAVAAAVCEEEGVDWEWHDGYKTGDLEIGSLTADIKSRVENEEKYKDLLVGMRDEGDESDIKADTYVQVLLNEDYTTALVTGWAFGFEARDASGFGGAQSYTSKIVDHDDLRDLCDLF